MYPRNARTRTRISRLTALLGTVALTIAGGLVNAAPATAASYDGDLLLKANGSVYTHSPVVSQAGAVGTTLSYGLEVVNRGTDVAQYRVQVADQDPEAPASLYSGSLLLSQLATSPDGYYTKALKPGASEVLTLKVTVPAGTDYEYVSTVSLQSTDGTELHRGVVITERASTTGTSQSDLFVKGNTQSVGGPNYFQIAGATTVGPTGTATFSVKLMNNGTSAAPIYLQLDQGGCRDFTLVAKQGLTVVTNQVLDGTFHTGALAPGKSASIAISIKSGGSCSWGSWEASAGPAPQPQDELVFLLVTTSL